MNSPSTNSATEEPLYGARQYKCHALKRSIVVITVL